VHAVHAHPVELDSLIVASAAMVRDRCERFAAVSTDVRHRAGGSEGKGCQTGEGFSGWQRVEYFMRQHVLRAHVLRVEMGLAPLTVTVSSTAPTRMAASSTAVNPVVSSICSRLTVLNPGRLNVTV
jgi:hypothetical protein